LYITCTAIGEHFSLITTPVVSTLPTRGYKGTIN
jgi:hypothetical protein